MGVGPAIGLVAIGWTVLSHPDTMSLHGPTLYCPAHNPAPVPCHRRDDNQKGKPCPLCASEDRAEWVRQHQPWPGGFRSGETVSGGSEQG